MLWGIGDIWEGSGNGISLPWEFFRSKPIDDGTEVPRPAKARANYCIWNCAVRVQTPAEMPASGYAVLANPTLEIAGGTTTRLEVVPPRLRLRTEPTCTPAAAAICWAWFLALSRLACPGPLQEGVEPAVAPATSKNNVMPGF